VDIAIKGLSDAMASRLQQRAAEHSRSAEEEARAILEAGLAAERPRTLKELHEKVRALGLRTPSDSVAILREDRDAHDRH
jgi:plasmid stability protein